MSETHVVHEDLRSDPRTLLARADRVLAPVYARPDVLFTRGKGCRLWSAEGREFLDLTSGIAVTAFGHGTEIVRRAVDGAGGDGAEHGLVHTSNLYHTAPAIELASLLVERSFADRVFFANSGAEAVEAAIKFARLHGGADRRGIVHFEGAFHGRTLGALTATDRVEYQDPFRPLPGGFRKLRFGEPEDLPQIDATTAAVLIEPIQGESGIRVAPAGWLRALRKRCDETGALL
ncbi:MAG: aminotransferase class III-fold pyridoxal phosphate-dependent enzyme, partial [Candidatus Eisenbacteria bacterium]|nr:aminotransferase class III-fold pyridoxal phosphate-dependent enzyme [Candidatus Eisenbacteria bacterium]